MIPGKTKGARRLGRETNQTNVAQSPRGEGVQITPLTASVDQVLTQIKDEEALTYPGKLKGDPIRHSKDKYCRFHRDHDHWIIQKSSEDLP